MKKKYAMNTNAVNMVATWAGTRVINSVGGAGELVLHTRNHVARINPTIYTSISFLKRNAIRV